jgi:hypothetical protein
MKVQTRQVTLNGIADIMFDRYAGDNKTELPVAKKMYYAPDGKTLILPATNIVSFLTAQNTPSAPKRFLDSRKYKAVAQAMLSYTSISPFEIPICRNGEPIVFNGFVDEEDKEAGVYVHRSVARLNKGVPNPKIRPAVRTPWSISFDISIFQNNEFNEDMLYDMFERGGVAVGLGTYRGVFGKFTIGKWETKK